jgi:nitrate reductase (cytochrome)
MKKNRLDRREFLKMEAAAMAAAAGGMPTTLAAQNLVTDRSFTELKWNKAPCRFCGIGSTRTLSTSTPSSSAARLTSAMGCARKIRWR